MAWRRPTPGKALALICLTAALAGHSPLPTFENSFIVAPVYVRYLEHSDEQFAREATELRARVGKGPYIQLGFAVFLRLQFADIDLNKPLDRSVMASSLNEIDMIVERARKNGLIVHIAVMTGFFHDSNKLRAGAIRQDVRNAQWFADGSIAPAKDLANATVPPDTIWTTPSRKAELMRRRIEEGVRIAAQHLAERMRDHPNTLLTVSGDGEVELSPGWAPNLLADYSPFMIEEFRDWLRETRYRGDLSPATDDDRDGHTFNKDFNQSFTTWRLRYFDASGPIPFAQYMQLAEKLPRSGRYFIDGGFDAPREEDATSALWKTWMEFRKDVVARWVKDFASWMRTSADSTGFTIPAERYFSHQIPAGHLFGARDLTRLKTSASPVETAFIGPLGSTGVTTFNIFTGKMYAKTATPALYETILKAGPNWGILEYHPAVVSAGVAASATDETYLLGELRELYRYRPHIIAPALWSDYPQHRTMAIRDTPFERALGRFVKEIGETPWAPALSRASGRGGERSEAGEGKQSSAVPILTSP